MDEISENQAFRVTDKKILIKSSANINYWAKTLGKMFLLTTNYKTTVYTNKGDFFQKLNMVVQCHDLQGANIWYGGERSVKLYISGNFLKYDCDFLNLYECTTNLNWALFAGNSEGKTHGFLVLVGTDYKSLSKWDMKRLSGKVNMIKKDNDNFLLIAKTNGLQLAEV
jgi:hypothetical protein